jgi:hypothetical protein
MDDLTVIRGPVEMWRGQIEKMMVTSLQDHTRTTAAGSRNTTRTDWILSVQDSSHEVIGFRHNALHQATSGHHCSRDPVPD